MRCVTSSRLRQEITILGIVVIGVATKGSSDLVEVDVVGTNLWLQSQKCWIR